MYMTFYNILEYTLLHKRISIKILIKLCFTKKDTLKYSRSRMNKINKMIMIIIYFIKSSLKELYKINQYYQ